jgi:hypothetical protein
MSAQTVFVNPRLDCSARWDYVQTAKCGYNSRTARWNLTSASTWPHVIASMKLKSLACLVAAALTGCLGPPSYRGFIEKDQPYFASIGNAFDELRTHAPRNAADGREPLPNEISLPPALQSLHPSYLRVSTNRVFMMVGVGPGAYSVIWRPVESTWPTWQLSVSAEGTEKVVFTTTSFGNQASR